MGSKGKSRWAGRAEVKKLDRQRRRNEARDEERFWRDQERTDLQKAWNQERNEQIIADLDGMTPKKLHYERLSREKKKNQ